MREVWPTVALSEVARLDVDRVPVVPGQVYKISGVLNAGQGMLERDAIDGSDTNYSVLHRLRAGQLVMRKLTAWEGPITVVPTEFDGHVASPEFPTFSLNEARLLPQYMRLVCQLPEFWDQMRDRSTGTVQRRKRVNPGQLLQVTIALPPLAEQRRIVDMLGAVDTCVAAAEHAAAAYRGVAMSLRDAHFAGRGDGVVRAGDFFEITMGRQRSPQHATGDHMVRYVRAANVKDGYLDLADVKSMNFTPVEQGKYRLQQGDVLISEGCGSLEQLGASARWPGGDDTVCFQNTLLRLRARPGISTPGYSEQWARYCFESGAFAAVAAGTNIFHIGAERAVEMPVAAIPVAEQSRFVETVAAADDAVAATDATEAALRTVRRVLLQGLTSGEHSIPADYDALLESALWRSRRGRRSSRRSSSELVRLGWTYIPGKNLPRSTDEVLIESHVTDALVRLNPLIAAEPEPPRRGHAEAAGRHPLGGQRRCGGGQRADDDLAAWSPDDQVRRHRRLRARAAHRLRRPRRTTAWSSPTR